MDDAFFNWLMDCHSEESLGLEELDLALRNRKAAFKLFMEFLDGDKENSGELAQDVIRDFKRRLTQRKSAGFPSAS